MRRNNDVFFFTLIDLLLQVLFFGLVLFVVGQMAVKATLEKAGVSNIAELTDVLTRMVPIDKLKESEAFIASNGGREHIASVVQIVKRLGGLEKATAMESDLNAANSRIKALEGERWGAPSCVPMVDGRPPAIARVVVRDQSITLEAPSSQFLTLLAIHGLKFEDVQSLSPAAFRSTFARVIAREPDCRYFLSSEARTEYLAPMRAVWSVFRTL